MSFGQNETPICAFLSENPMIQNEKRGRPIHLDHVQRIPHDWERKERIILFVEGENSCSYEAPPHQHNKCKQTLASRVF